MVSHLMFGIAGILIVILGNCIEKQNTLHVQNLFKYIWSYIIRFGWGGGDIMNLMNKGNLSELTMKP